MPDGDVYPRIIRLASECRTASDFSKVLEALTDYADADGCIIWEIFHAGTSERKYFKLADHFPVEDAARQPPWHFLPEKCVTARAIQENEVQFVDDLDAAVEKGEVPNAEYLTARNISSFCSIPISFGSRREAAVNFYRKKKLSFREDCVRLERAARTLPDLNHGVLNQIGFELLRKVEVSLNGGGDVLQNVLDAVAKQFNAHEAAIYLGDWMQTPGEYTLQAVKWPFQFPSKKTYRTGDEGITIWAIEHGVSVRFVDLGHFHEETRTRKYDGMTWLMHDDLLAFAEKTYGAPPPPLGLVCAPILDRKKVVGAIRCCMTQGAPHLFDDSHIAILDLVADQIGHWWGNQLALGGEQQEKLRFKALVEGITQMHSLAFQALNQREPDMLPLWNRSLELIEKLTPWPDALSIRTVDDDTKELRFASVRGKAWKEGGDRLFRARLDRRYALSGNFAGSQAVRDRKVIVEHDAGKPGKLRSELFPSATRLIHAPILFGHEVTGVVDVRGFGPKAIPVNLGLMCELIGGQLGLYQAMLAQFQTLKRQEKKLEKQYEEQNQIYEDFLHQLRNPLSKASILANRASDPQQRTESDVKQLRTFVRQVLKFSESLNHFIALSKGEPIRASLEVLTYEYLVGALQQMAADESVIVSPERRLRFVVDNESFEPFRRKTVYAAKDLLEQCLFNLLDNAAKYSSSNTEITLRGGAKENKGTLTIAVLNKGHRIESSMKKRLIERGYRGDRALRTTASGRGIGLWIVQQFMEAMGGSLNVVPTDGRGLNEFQLVFKVA